MKKVIFFFTFLAFITTSDAQTKTEQLDELLTAYTNKYQFNGTALVLDKGKELLNKGYGLRDAETDFKNNAHTVFKIGSITKQFTATVILKLVEQGKLKLNDKLNTFFPDYPKGDSITIHHLLSHTSGIFSYTDDSDFIQNKSSNPATQAMMLSLFKDKPMTFPVGSDWAYSNSGYMLLGYIIEKVTHEPYESVIKKLIFNPLGMTHSGFDFAHLSIPNKATGYFSIKDKNKGKEVDSTVSYSAGAIYSTTDDLLKWHKALLKNSIIKRSTLEKAFTPYKNKFGYGWVVDSFVGKKGVYHNGSILGFTSNIYRVEADDVCIILLCNIGTPKIDDITKGLLSVLYDKPYVLPNTPKAIPVSAEIVGKYLGIFEFSPKFKANIIREATKLYAQRVGDAQKHLLIPIAKNRFFVSDVEQELEFVENEKGEFNNAILHTDDQPMTAQRVQSNPIPSLRDTIVQLDKAFFEAYNQQNLQKMLSFLSDDLEFFHDLGGLSHFEENKKAFEQNFKSNKNSQRTLVEESLEVYPIKNYGAIQVAAHSFCHSENGKNDCETVKFVHVWQRKNDVWKITRIISYAH